MFLILLILVSGCTKNINEDDKILLDAAVEGALKYGVQECNYFSDEELRQRCIGEYNIRVEERNVKASYLKEAVENNDITRCEALADSGKKEFCKEMYTAMLVFINGKDMEYCEVMKDPVAKLNCQDVYYMYKAITEDKSYCEKIKDIGIKKGCVEE